MDYRRIASAIIASILAIILASCGGAGSGSGGSPASGNSPTAISGSFQGTYSNLTAIVFDQAGTEIGRTLATQGASGSSFSLSVAPGTYKVMFVTNDGTAHQGITYCCFSPFAGTLGDGVNANIFTLPQGATLLLESLLNLGGNGVTPPMGVSLGFAGIGGDINSQAPIDINGKWNLSRTVTSSQCPDKPAGFLDAPVATITQSIDTDILYSSLTPPTISQVIPGFGGSVTVTTDAGETFTGSSDGNLVYISEFQTVPATNTSSTTYELMTIAADGKSMTGTFKINEISAKCLAQGTLTATKQ